MSRKLNVSMNKIDELIESEGTISVVSSMIHHDNENIRDGGQHTLALSNNFNPTLFKFLNLDCSFTWNYDTHIHAQFPLNGGSFGVSTYTLYIGGGKSGTQNFKIKQIKNSALGPIFPWTSPTIGSGGGSLVVRGYFIADDDWNATDTFCWVGDSVSAGTVNGNLARLDYFQFLVKKFLLNKTGKLFRLILRAQGGQTSETVKTSINTGFFNICSPKIIFYQMGINDAGSSLALDLYEENIRIFVRYVRTYTRNAYIIMLGSTPLENNAKEATLDTYRERMSNIVASLNNDGDNNIFYINLKKSFDRTLGYDVYSLSDTTIGERLHPGTALANSGIANVICNGINYDNTTTTGLNQLIDGGLIKL